MKEPDVKDDDFDAAVDRHFAPARYKATQPMDYTPQRHEQRHVLDTAPGDFRSVTEHQDTARDDDKCKPGEGAGVIVIPMLVLSVIAAGALVAWISQ